MSRLGADATRVIITKGKGGMPAIPTLSPPLLNDLMAFLTKPESAPPGIARASAPALAGGRGGTATIRIDVTPPPSRYKTGYGNEPYVITPPWSQITAYDLNTGKIKWQTPYGDLPQAGPSDKLRGNVYPKSGFVITAGGLVLFAGNDSKLYALDKDTGKLLLPKICPMARWAYPRSTRPTAGSTAADCLRRQPFPAGGRLAPGGVNPPAISKSYIAFALPETKK